MTDEPSFYAHYRLNFEQQQKRAKELLRAARSREPEALARFAAQGVAADAAAPPRLAAAQHVIACELRFATWADLKHHIALLGAEREALARGRGAEALDGDLRTLHVRCGSDIEPALRRAGFDGDFLEHGYPYLAGPVRDGGPGCLEQRARFIVETHAAGDPRGLTYEGVLEGLRRGERALLESAAKYERIVIWSELDCYDQLVLIRLLSHYARDARPRVLELVDVGDFPGAMRFIGLGHLPPEALRMLWPRRTPATPARLALGERAFRALANDDPRFLAAIAREGTPELPLLARALRRHLSELPGVRDGLSCTERMALESLAAVGEMTLNRLFARMTYLVDPLPGQGDSTVCARVLAMERAAARVFTRRPGTEALGDPRPTVPPRRSGSPDERPASGAARSPWTDVLTITDVGRRVLRAEVDFRSLAPPPRWVGGVLVEGTGPLWRWDDGASEAVWR